MISRTVVWYVMFELTRFGLTMVPEWKCSSCATYLISSWARMRGKHPYVSPHCVVLNVLVTFSSSVVRILMDPEVGCPTIFVKVASPKVAFTIEVIDAVASLGFFFPRHLALSGSFWIDYHIFRAATASDGRERTDNPTETNVFDSRLVFRIVSFDRISGDSVAALRGICFLNQVSGDSIVALQYWFRNQISPLGQR